MVVPVVFVVDVFKVDLGIAHRVPALPCDPQDHERDHETDYRVGELEPKRDDGSAAKHAEIDEASTRALRSPDERHDLALSAELACRRAAAGAVN